MSPDPRRPSKAERQSAAREKARLMREQQERAARRRKAGLITLAGLVVIAIAAAVGITIATSGDDDVPQATPTTFTDDGGFVVGQADAPVTVDVYLDYQCPFCAQFEQQNSEYLAQVRESGQVAVEYHPLNFLSRFGDYSVRAASAAVCVAEQAPEQFVAFNDALFVNQPAEGAGGLSDRQIESIADEAGVPDAVDDCITSGKYTDYITEQTQDVDERVRATPSVFVNGELLEDPSSVQSAVAAALAGAAPAASPGSSTAPSTSAP